MKRSRIVWSLLAAGLVAAAPARARISRYGAWSEPYNAQALIGAVQYDGLKFTIPDSASPREADLSLMPQLGGAWSTLPLGDRFQYGLESTLLVGFRGDRLNYLYAGNGTLYIDFTMSLWNFDLAGGGYASLYLDEGRNVRIYTGGGPMMMYTSYRSTREYSDGTEDLVESESAFGVGGYARAGVEVRARTYGLIGLGVRGVWTNSDFGDVGGSDHLSGVSVLATYTVGF